MIFPLIGGILALISLFIPIAIKTFSDSTAYVWPFWVLNIYQTPSFQIIPHIITDLVFSYVGITVMILYIFAIFVIFLSLFRHYKEHIKEKTLVPLWFISGAALLIGLFINIYLAVLYVLEGYLLTYVGLIFYPIAVALIMYGAYLLRKETR